MLRAGLVLSFLSLTVITVRETHGDWCSVYPAIRISLLPIILLQHSSSHSPFLFFVADRETKGGMSTGSVNLCESRP